MMKTTTNDPIVDEVRRFRDQHTAQFGYDIQEIFKNIRSQQKSSGRKYVRFPARPAGTTTAATSKE